MPKEILELKQLQEESRAKKAAYFASIPERTIEIARLRYKEGLTYQAIGERYGITRQAVHKLLKKGL